jgi:hypothetical protein
VSFRHDVLYSCSLICLDIEGETLYNPVPKIRNLINYNDLKSVNINPNTENIRNKMKNAGMAAIAHFTIKVTIDQKLLKVIIFIHAE